MIEDRKLKPGTKLVAKYKGREHRAEVVVGKDSKLCYRLADGREFASPSGAGSAVMGGISCNGWRFWSPAKSDDTIKSESQPAKRGRKPGRSARVLPKTKAHGKAKVGRNGQTPAVGWSGRGSR